MNNKKSHSIKITVIGTIIDFVLAIVKISVGYISNSQAMIADGLHSFSDLVSDGITLFAAKHSSEAPDKEHPYGHAKFETIATLALSVILSIVGFGILIDAILTFGESTQLLNQTTLIFVAIISIISKEALYWATIFIAKKYHSTMLLANAWHHRSDALSSIIVLAGIIGSINGYYYLDNIAAAIIGIMINYIAWCIGFPATQELVDTAIDDTRLINLKAKIRKISGVVDIHMLRSRKNSSNVAMDVHIQVKSFLSVSEGHIISVSVERIAKECIAELNDIVVHIDPEDDEEYIPSITLPERGEALEIINQQLLNSAYNKYIDKITLHYLSGAIKIDFYLPLSCLEQNNTTDLHNNLQKTIANPDIFNEIRLYFY